MNWSCLPAEVNAVDWLRRYQDGSTALHVAVAANDLSARALPLLRCLLAAGADEELVCVRVLRCAVHT